MKEVKKRYPNFKDIEACYLEEGQETRDPKVVTFAKLLHQIEVEDK